MGFSYRRSVKMGPVRLNISKSGMGISTGVRGLRVGVNAKGKSYVSAGTGGFYYRKNLGSNSSTYSNTSTFQSNSNTSYGGIVFGIFLLFLGFISPYLLIIPFCIFAYYIAKNVQKNNLKNKIEKYSNQLNIYISENKLQDIGNLISSFREEIGGTSELAQILSPKYKELLDKVLEDKKISEDEKRIIELFINIIPDEESERVNLEIIEHIFYDIVRDKKIDVDEEDYIKSVTEVFQLSTERKTSIAKKINDYKKLQAIEENGLTEIIPSVKESDNCRYYYENAVETKKIRSNRGNKYYDTDSFGKVIISSEIIRIITDTNIKIKIVDIASIERDDDNIVVVISIKRKTPYVFQIDDPITFIAIIRKLM